MKIKILGSGCSKCKALAASAQQAVAELKLDATVEKEEDMIKILAYQVMRTPALVVDGKVVAQGKVLSVNEVKKILS